MNAPLTPTDTSGLAERPGDPVVVPPVSAIAAEIGADAQTLVEQHGELLKAELKETGEQATWSVVLILAGTVGCVLGGLFFLIGLVRLTAWLWPTLPEWAAWLIWGGGVLLAAGVSLLVGARTVSQLSLIPHRTLRSLRESWSCLTKRQK